MKGHRPASGRLTFGPRIVVVSGPVRRETTQMLCGQPVTYRRRAQGGHWVHGTEPGSSPA